jgi:hypothetical protein
MHTSPIGIIIEVLSVLFALISPLIIFIVCHFKRSAGKEAESKTRSTVKAEYLRPVEIATLMNNDVYRPIFFWPEIVGLAIDKTITIEKLNRKLTWDITGRYTTINVFGVATSITQAQFEKLETIDRVIVDTLFAGSRKIDLFASRDYLCDQMPRIGEAVRLSLARKGLVSEENILMRNSFIAVGAALLALGLLFADIQFAWRLSALVSGSIAIGFGATTRKTTPAGDLIIEDIKKMRKTIATIKKDKIGTRARREKFEELIPIAMALGSADILTQKATATYGSRFIKEYRPSWYKDFDRDAKFDAGRLLGQLNETFTFNSFRPLIDLPR